MSQAPLTDDQLITQFRQTYSDPPENPLDEDDNIQNIWDRFDGTQPASGEGTLLPVNDNQVDLFWHANDANDGVLSAFGGVGQDLYLGGRDVDLDGKDGDDDAYLWVKDYEPGVDQLIFPFDRGPEIQFDGSFLSYETSEGKVDRVFKLKEGGYAPETVAGDIAFLNTLQDGNIILPFIFDSQKNISFTVPESLDDGKLDVANGENPLLEFSGRLEAPLNSALFTFISSKDSNDKTRDQFRFDVNSSILDQNGNFAVTTDLSWNRSDSYQIGSISTNLGSWNLLSTPEQTATFMAATGIDPNDLSSFNLELLNNRTDRTYPQASLSADALDNGILNVDAGEYGLGIKGFLEDRRDDGEPGSGSPRIDIYWAEAAGAHQSVNAAVSPEAAQFLQVHTTSYYNQPQWESTEWASGANAFGQVDLDTWDDNRFRWAMPGQWIVRSARLSDEAKREGSYPDYTWLNDDSQGVYPSLEYQLQWNSEASQYEPVISSSSYQIFLDKAEFEQVYGIDLDTIEFSVVNSTPDVTPPKFTRLSLPGDLSDKILDLTQGERLAIDAEIVDSAATSTVSGFQNAQIRLRRAYEYDDQGNRVKVKVENLDWDSDYIDLHISNYGGSSYAVVGNGSTVEVDGFLADQGYKFKNDGDYVFYNANIWDMAGNYYSYSKGQSDYDSLDSSAAGYDPVIAAQIQQKDADFKSVTGIDLDLFNFRLINPNPDSTLPRLTLDSPEQLSNDNILDIPSGESSQLVVSGSIQDLDNNGNPGSGLSNLSITFQDVATNKSKYLYINASDLDANGKFSRTLDFANDAPGSWRIVSAHFSDKANNWLSYYLDNDPNYNNYDDTKAQLKAAGLDLDQWEFTLKNNQYDNTPPQGNVVVPTQLNDGTLDLSTNEDPVLTYAGSFTDGEGQGFDYFNVQLYNAADNKSIYLNLGEWQLEDDGTFAFDYDANWDSGVYRPKSAYLSDKAENRVSVYSDDVLSANQIIRFRQASGIDLSSSAFNFEVVNSQADSSAPMVENFQVSGNQLRVVDDQPILTVSPSTDATISYQGSITDEPAGFDSLWLELRARNSNRTVSRYLNAYDLGDDGDFQIDIDFAYLPSGDWYLSGLNLRDRANNSLYFWDDGVASVSVYEQQQIDALKDHGIDVNAFDLTVVNANPDTSAPTFSDIQTSFDEVTSRFSLEGVVSDDLSGFSDLWLRFIESTTQQDFWVNVGATDVDWATGDNGQQRNGTFSFSQRLRNLPAGTYEVQEAQFKDRAGNSIEVYTWSDDRVSSEQHFANAGLDLSELSVDIATEAFDQDLPVFSDVTFSQSGTIAASENSLLTLSGLVSDGEGSGFAELQVILSHQSGAERLIHLHSDQVDEAGEFSLNVDFAHAASGRWDVKEAFLRDQIGNTASFYDGNWDSAAEAKKFKESGLDLQNFEFEVVNLVQQDDVLPIVRDLELQRIDDRVELRGLVDDGANGSGLDRFQVNLYNFTIKEWIQLEVNPEDLAADGSFSVSSDYGYLTSAEWRIENIALSDLAGNYVNYWRSGWDADQQSNRLVGSLLAPGGGSFVIDPLLDLSGGETVASLVNGDTGAIELAFEDVFSRAGDKESALEDDETIADALSGLESALTPGSAIVSELISFNADVSGVAKDPANNDIFRFELNLPGDPNKVSIKKQYADRSKGFVDFKTVYADALGASSVGGRKEGLTVENDTLVLYVQDNGIFDHDLRLGHITDPFVVTNEAKALKNLVQPKPIARPESVIDAQQQAELSASSSSNADANQGDSDSSSAETTGSSSSSQVTTSSAPSSTDTASTALPESAPETADPGTSGPVVSVANDTASGRSTVVITPSRQTPDQRIAIDPGSLADSAEPAFELADGVASTDRLLISFENIPASAVPLALDRPTEGGGTILDNAPPSLEWDLLGVYFNSGVGDDDIIGSAESDFLRAGAGDDIIDAGAGDDLVRSGAGSDRITLGAGNDVLYVTVDQLDGAIDTITDFDEDADRIALGEGTQFSISGNSAVFRSEIDGVERLNTLVFEGLDSIASEWFMTT